MVSWGMRLFALRRMILGSLTWSFEGSMDSSTCQLVLSGELWFFFYFIGGPQCPLTTLLDSDFRLAITTDRLWDTVSTLSACMRGQFEMWVHCSSFDLPLWRFLPFTECLCEAQDEGWSWGKGHRKHSLTPDSGVSDMIPSQKRPLKISTAYILNPMRVDSCTQPLLEWSQKSSFHRQPHHFEIISPPVGSEYKDDLKKP